MFTKSIIKRIPDEKIPNDRSFNLEGLHHDYEGFRILLRDKSYELYMLRICFVGFVSYRMIDEGDYLQEIFNDGYSFPRSFYSQENSEYIERFVSQSYGKRNNQDLKHYCIYTSNDCIDVLTTGEPLVERLGPSDDSRIPKLTK